MKKAVAILHRIFRDHPRDFNLKLWNGHLIEWTPCPKFTLIFNDKSALKKLLLNGDQFTAGELFINQRLDVEGDIFEAVKLGDHLSQLKLGRREKLLLFAQLLTL